MSAAAGVPPVPIFSCCTPPPPPCCVCAATHRMSGNHVYDFFMGAVLHPRIGPFDLKLFAEIRISWFLLFINTASCAYTQWHALGIADRFVAVGPLFPGVFVPRVPLPMLLMLIAHFLYANACAKVRKGVGECYRERYPWSICVLPPPTRQGEHYVAPTWGACAWLKRRGRGVRERDARVGVRALQRVVTCWRR